MHDALTENGLFRVFVVQMNRVDVHADFGEFSYVLVLEGLGDRCLLTDFDFRVIHIYLLLNILLLKTANMKRFHL